MWTNHNCRKTDDSDLGDFPYLALFIAPRISRCGPGGYRNLNFHRFVLELAWRLWLSQEEADASRQTSYHSSIYRKGITMSRSKSDSDSRRLFTVNFRMLMEAADWTQMEAAAELGISQGSVSDFSSGNRLPSMKGIESIAYRLGLPGRDVHGEADQARPDAEAPIRHPLAQGRRTTWRLSHLQALRPVVPGAQATMEPLSVIPRGDARGCSDAVWLPSPQSTRLVGREVGRERAPQSNSLQKGPLIWQRRSAAVDDVTAECIVLSRT